MMAAEPTLENLAVVSASLDSNDQSTTTQHGVNHVSNLNGNATPGDDIFNKRIANVEEQCNSADVSVSGGSDTEGTKHRDGDRSHARTSSAIKKPATFKAVSVNKTFLGAKSSVPIIQPKSSEKPAGGSSTPPPGSVSLSTSRPRLVAKTGPAKDFSAIVNGRSGASPDPSAVWNKNRPPEPKKFTDEELQKYGIHMASRLNEEDAQGQNKWADIDDDDEDWAPEAITWGDGTKTTITNDVPPMPEIEEPLGMPTRESLPPRPLQHAMMQQPGPLPRPNALPSGKGMVLRNATQDRPALVAKPPAPPTPVKSPWASLPPVEAPAQNWSPEAAYGDRMMREHGQSRDPGHRPKEIAADDFSRSGYRGNNGYGSRELFNSQSGRYEPVQERRSSMRSEHPARQHGMLQRPMGGEHPLDIPNAYQQSRPGQEMTFGRRRGSSNVSGGSGSMYPRGLKGQDGTMPQEMATGRRLSFAGSNDGMPPAGGPPGSMHRQQPSAGWSQRSPAATFATPHTEQVDVTQGGGQPMTDEVEYQKKLMRERVELARKRRQDEEAREDAARKERIQKKLDAMGPAPEKKPEKRDEAETHPTQIQRRELSDTADGPQHQDGSKKSPGTKHTTPRRLSHGQSGKTPESWSGSGPRPERFTSWAAGPSPPQPSRNVWGSPNNDRGLGNGTFNPDLGRIPGSTDTGKGSSPGAVPTGSQAPAAARGATAAPIGSRTSRYDGNGPDLANKWVNAVADGDKQVQAARLAEKSQQEQQLAERGLGIENAQPAIKETWRQVQLTADGSRRPVGNVEVKHPPSTNAWKSSREDGQSAPRRGDVPQSPDAGVIGSGNRSMLHQQGPAGASHKTSRFFPSKEPRFDSSMPRRSSSPTPPPPTMEGHPAYEGNSRRPNVSLPKPQPVVKLPPAAMANQVSQNVPWTSRQRSNSALRASGYDGARAADGSGNWQDRINNLLNGGKPSPPKTVSTLDISSRPTLEQHVPERSATVSLPAAKRTIPPAAVAKPHKVAVTETKPMAEECFEEQEMGSLPKIRIPNKVSEAAWQPATPPAKYLPRKFAVESAIIDPFAMSEISGNASVARIQLPGMTTPKSVPLPQSPQTSSRGGRGGTSSRASPRGRGSGLSTRGAKRDREVSVSHGDKSPSTPSRGSRGSRGTYRGRGSENWNRRTVSQTQQSPTLA